MGRKTDKKEYNRAKEKEIRKGEENPPQTKEGTESDQ
jgi:hypothetical protein